MHITRIAQSGKKIEIRQTRERDESFYRYSAQDTATGKFLVVSALSGDYDEELDAALAAL